ncbi:hypothetical protein WJX84_004808 [Apatococcus fuscideae]|uniref:Uncharacterized protein n=1 Tax=Apatococcus fuscideae TaxID=2026836 RepID=A0AAW1TCG3_9CHLO
MAGTLLLTSSVWVGDRATRGLGGAWHHGADDYYGGGGAVVGGGARASESRRPQLLTSALGRPGQTDTAPPRPDCPPPGLHQLALVGPVRPRHPHTAWTPLRPERGRRQALSRRPRGQHARSTSPATLHRLMRLYQPKPTGHLTALAAATITCPSA